MNLLSPRSETNFYVIVRVPRDTEIDHIPLYLERRFLCDLSVVRI